MLPYIIGAGAILGLAAAGCGSSEEETPEQLEQKIVGKDLIESTERRVRAMESSEHQSAVKIRFECNDSLLARNSYSCTEQNENFMSWIHRNYAKKFDIECFQFQDFSWNKLKTTLMGAECEIRKLKPATGDQEIVPPPTENQVKEQIGRKVPGGMDW